MNVGDVVAYCAMTDFYRPAAVVEIFEDGLLGLRLYDSVTKLGDEMSGNFWEVAPVQEGDGIGEWLPKEEVWPTN